jgi:hypothetical protein
MVLHLYKLDGFDGLDWVCLGLVLFGKAKKKGNRASLNA